MKKVLIVGGNSGLGLSLAINFLNLANERIIVDKENINELDIPIYNISVFSKKVRFIKYNLLLDDLSIFDNLQEVVYFPYTKSTNNTQIRKTLTKVTEINKE